MRRTRNKRNNARVFARGLSLLLFLASAPLAYASQTSGTIDSAHKYAWSDVGGYVNFAPTNSTVSVTDTGLTGYAWSANTGWINLSPSHGGVTNTASGTLGGFAWDANEGWISFTGVTIDANGVFHGTATGASENIKFDCTNCSVQTDWRPSSARTTTTTTTTVAPANGSISPIFVPTVSSTQTNTSTTHSPTPNTTGPSSVGAPRDTSPSSGNPPSTGAPLYTNSPYGTTLTPSQAGTSTPHLNPVTHKPIPTSQATSSPSTSFARAAAVPAGIIAILLIAFFVFRFFF
ncbi:MAG: hypothetical protein ACYCZZ_03145 [Minisyncoccota bacterium]